MIDLYRFVKEEHLESFLNGDLYMSSLGYFWSHGFEGQNDIFEGVCEAQDPQTTQIQEPVRSAIKGSVLFRMNAYQYCNMLCFYKHKVDLKRKQTTVFGKEMKEFGDYAIRILDPEIFITRLQMYAEDRDDYFLAGSVHYHRRDEVTDQLDCFDKMQKYAAQNEWRVAYVSDFKKKQDIAKNNPTSTFEEALTVKIGDIRSLTEVYKVDNLIASPLNVYRGFKIVDTISGEDEKLFSDVGLPHSTPWYEDEYHGWGDRATFQNKVMELDGGRMGLMFSI